ncbi:hypothetical protein TNCV_842521 [Trichonephila clavipes]|nr:hypothetical protein TNCV_842521 [Trichonephila clavipes]
MALNRLSCWPEAYPISDMTAETVAARVIREWIPRFGVPGVSESTFSKQQMPVCEVWPMRRRVNLTSVLRIGITGHAPMTGFTECSLLSNC